MAKLQIEQALRFGWEVTKKNFGLFFSVMVVTALVNIAPSLVSGILGYADYRLNEAVDLVLSFIGWVLSVFLQAGVIRMALRATDLKPIVLNDIFASKDIFKPFILASLLSSIIITAGYVLFIIPGIVASLSLFFYAFIIADGERGPVNALRHSYALTKGFRWQLLGFLLVSCLINVLGFFALFIGLLWALPTTTIATAHIYRQLSPAK